MSEKQIKKRTKQKSHAYAHQLHDTVSFVDKASEVPLELLDKYITFVVELADTNREETSKYTSTKQWTDHVLRLRKKHKIHPRKAQIKKLYDDCLTNGTIIDSNLNLEQYLQKRASRSLSGILVIATLMSPYPVYLDSKTGKVKQQRFSCQHNCYYCPNEPGMPRSYLSKEAAVSRALRVDFNAIDQFYTRAHTLQKLGHAIDKIELLILGGTFCQFPVEYQEEFIRDLYWSANTFYDGICDFKLKRSRKSLSQEIKIHETATKCRIIGLTLETRPDTIRDFNAIKKFREFGATRLQIGVQHTDDEILKNINRGCCNSDTIKAIRLLKNCGYKIDIHLMPNLPGSTPQKDIKMFNDLLSNDLIQCDQWKVYPCQTVDFSLIKKWYETKKYKPYSLDKLINVIIHMKSNIKPWIRLNRIFRALPQENITHGITISNFRQHMYKEMTLAGLKCKCIRCREIGTHIRRNNNNNNNNLKCKLDKKDIILKKRQYKSSGGDEIFISLESKDESILMGFVRLRLPPLYIKPSDRQALGLSTSKQPFLNINKNNFNFKSGKYGDVEEYAQLIETFPELYQAALVREAHVYGAKQKVIQTCDNNHVAKKKNEIRETLNLTGQSRGYGSLMMKEAEKIARNSGYSRVVVIASVGTRLFYRLKLGYKSAGTYMVKDFNESALGQAARIDRNKIHLSFLKAGTISSIAVCLALYILSTFLSILLSLILVSCFICYLDYLHFYKIKYTDKVNKSLLRLSKIALLLINLALIFKYLSAFLPQIAGDCYCQTYWSMTLVCYVSAFYLLKLIYHKRVIIMIQNPMFGNDSGIKSVPISITGLLLGQILAFSLCQFLVLNYVTSHCVDEPTSQYDKTSPFGCHDTFEAIDIWIAILVIIFDATLFSIFCSKWYAIMLIFMEEMATSLLVQFSLVNISMISCIVNASLHMILLYSNHGKDTFDSFLGTPSFCLDCSIMATCLVLSFTDSQKYVMNNIGIHDLKPYYQSLENLGYALHIM